MPIKRLSPIFEKYRWIPWVILITLFLILGVMGYNLFGRGFFETLTPDERAWVKEHSPLRFAPDPAFKPIEFFDNDGNYQGIMADYFKLIEERLRIDIEIVHYPTWQDVLNAAENGEIDGITAAQITPERLRYLAFTSPILDIPNVIICRNDRVGTLRLEEMDGWTLAMTKGYATTEYVRTNFPYITIKEMNNDMEALQEVSFRRADATIINQAIATELLQESGITNLRIAGDSGRSNSLAIGVKSNEPVLLGIMEKGLGVISNREKDDIYQEWIGFLSDGFYSTPSFWFTIFWALVALTVILGFSLAWNSTLRLQVDSKTAQLNQELSEKQVTESKLNQQLDNLSALRAVGVAINASMDLPLTLNILLDQISSKLNVDACRILLLNPYSRSLEHTADRGFRTPYLRGVNYHMGNSSFAWNSIRSRKVVFENLTDHSDNPLDPAVQETEGFVSYIGAPLISKGSVKGVLEIYNRSPHPKDQVWLDFLEAMTSQAAIALDNATMFQDLQRVNLDLTLAYDATIEGWARALELRDGATEGHSQRVTKMTLDLASRMGIPDEDLIHVRRGALLHDIGKMGIPDNILLKPGPLTPDEWETMRRHPVYAYEMLRSIDYLTLALDIPHYHHEKFDGTGYPSGLKGDRIPLAARVFSVIDVWDALTSDRPYRKSWDEEKVLAYIKDNAGSHFDPEIVSEFLNLMKMQ
jgi:putative nucleotidyltransferase with HDIG domain